MFLYITSTFACTVYSLCTTLSLEWEPDLIAISVLYLSCRLMKFKVTSWVDKPDYYTGKWYSFFVSDVNLDIIESKFLIIVWIWFVVSAVCSLFLLLNHSSDSCP